MIRVSRRADYGVVAMTHIARDPRARHTAASIAAQTGVPQPSASKLMKLLAKAGILTSHRGAKGGYVLAHAPEQVSVAALVAAVDGPISLADWLDGPSGICELESFWLGARPLAEDQRRDPRRAGGSEPRRHGPGGGGRGQRACAGAVCWTGARVMSAQQEAAQAVESYAGERYKYGFVTDVEVDSAPPGLDHNTIRIHLRQEG